MTVGELIERLKEHDLDLQVRIAHQPKWAFEYSIDEVASTLDEMTEFDHERDEPVVYISEGTQLGYLPDNAAKAVGWR